MSPRSSVWLGIVHRTGAMILTLAPSLNTLGQRNHHTHIGLSWAYRKASHGYLLARQGLYLAWDTGPLSSQGKRRPATTKQGPSRGCFPAWQQRAVLTSYMVPLLLPRWSAPNMAPLCPHHPGLMTVTTSRMKVKPIQLFFLGKHLKYTCKLSERFSKNNLHIFQIL